MLRIHVILLFTFLDMDCKGPLRPHPPFPACYTLLSYNFVPGAKSPRFLLFLEHLCSGYGDRKGLLRAFMRFCLCSWTHVQKFLEVVGQARTGKTTLLLLMMALVGFYNSVVTALRDLNSNSFEAYNLQHKKLICVSHTETYSGSVGVLKQITGNDYLLGRKKHQQGAVNIYIEGMVLIVGNYPKYPRDATTGLLRRLIQIPATNNVLEGAEANHIQCLPSGLFEDLWQKSSAEYLIGL